MILRGIRRLQCLSSASPHAIYWSYLASCGGHLALTTDTEEDLVVLRLACLMRALPGADIGLLKETWANLSQPCRASLSRHLLADGIKDLAFMLAFLPDYLVNSRKNPVVGFR